MYRSPANFYFSLLRQYQMPERFYFNNCCFSLEQQFYHAAEIGDVANAVSNCAAQP